MAAATRPSTKTITMPPAPEESVPEPVTQRKPADGGRFRLQVVGKRKARMRPMKLRKQRDEGSRNTIRSFRSRYMTV
jgi:hypothetical protein